MVSSLQTSRSSRVVRAPAGAFGPTVLGTELATETAVTTTGYRERISANFLGVILVGSGVVRGMLVGCREFGVVGGGQGEFEGKAQGGWGTRRCDIGKRVRVSAIYWTERLPVLQYRCLYY